MWCFKRRFHDTFHVQNDNDCHKDGYAQNPLNSVNWASLYMFTVGRHSPNLTICISFFFFFPSGLRELQFMIF